MKNEASGERRQWPEVVEIAHPISVAAMLVLGVNDHVLKGCGLLPGWLTGKLSDVAGMVFFPIWLSAMERAGRRAIASSLWVSTVAPARAVRARVRAAGACACAALVFSFIKALPPVAHIYAEVLGQMGLVSRVTYDLSDLWALAVLPVPFALIARAERRPAHGPPMRL